MACDPTYRSQFQNTLSHAGERESGLHSRTIVDPAADDVIGMHPGGDPNHAKRASQPPVYDPVQISDLTAD